MGKKHGKKNTTQATSQWWVWLPMLVAQLFLMLLVMETLLHVFPQYIPLALVEHMPARIKGFIAARQGALVHEALRGDGQLYYGDRAADLRRPSPLDANGYNNPDIPRGGLDVVLLGDSIFAAEGQDKDLGAIFRDHGYRAYTMAMGAYGPYQYLSAYRKFILKPGVAHRCVVVAYNSGTDFSDTDKYLKVREAKGDWRDYLGSVVPDTQADTGKSGLWSWHFIRSLPEVFTPWLTATKLPMPPLFKRGFSAPEAIPLATVSLPYHEFRMDAGMLHYLNIMATTNSTAIPHAMTAYRTITKWAREKAHAQMLVVQLPTWAGLYGDYVDGHADERLLLEITYRWAFHNLQRELAKMDITTIDAREVLAPALERELITVTPDNVHLNVRGLEILYEFIAAHLTDCRS